MSGSPQPVAPVEATVATGPRPLEAPLLIAGLRCTVRYVVLPFVLPLLGVATGKLGIVTGAAIGLLLAIDVIAGITIVVTLRRLWSLEHPYRWRYLALAVALSMFVGVMFVNDARVLLV